MSSMQPRTNGHEDGSDGTTADTGNETAEADTAVAGTATDTEGTTGGGDAPDEYTFEDLSVVMGTLPEDVLVGHMARADALVVMKIGRNFAKVCDALHHTGRFDDAWLIEYAAMADQTVQRLSEAGDRVAPYFSIIVVHGNGRRP